MLFNSIEFLIFLPIVFVLYWFVTNKNLKIQNSLLILASYVFYGWWDLRFLSLIVFSSGVDYFVGIGLGRSNDLKKRRLLLFLSVFVNLGFLGVFKYFNFFVENFAYAFSFFGKSPEISRLNIILPVGISFYTFQTLSYSIDVYRRKLEPTTDALSFFAFVSFFPQLVAGPIERATNLLPQFYKKRNFSYDNALKGVSQIVWGLFKKIVIADSCAFVVNRIFEDYGNYSGSTLLLGAILFAFQIYGDFSGYSDITIGTSKLFGFELKRNFSYPYFARDIAEFWRRWHISLTTWFRDYVYIPLGGSRGSTLKKTRNVFVIFLISGFWHGANWTFVMWGAYNALLFVPLMFTNKNRRNLDLPAQGKILPSLKEILQIGATFLLVVLGWIFFRADNIHEAFDYFSIIFSKSLIQKPYVFGIGIERIFLTLLFIATMFVIEWLNRAKDVPVYFLTKKNWINWSIIFIIAMMIFLFGEKQQEFIYFQF